MEALDPDAVDPKAYTLTTPDFRFAKYADWYAVLTDEHALWDNGLGKIGLNKAGKWRVIDATGVPTKIFKGKTYSTAMDVAMALWLETNKRVTETLDPDAVDPHQYLKSTFAAKTTVQELMWYFDGLGARALGARVASAVAVSQKLWRVYGYIHSNYRRAKTVLRRVFTRFGLPSDTQDLDSSMPDQVINREFQFFVPYHMLKIEPGRMAPPGSLVRDDTTD